MPDYLSSSDIQLLRERGFTVGAFGESWFGMDKDEQPWQAYVIPGDDRLTFVGEDRISQYMKRSDFEEMFPKE